MPFIGKQPTAVPLTSSDITDGIVSTAKIADDAVDNTKLDLTDDFAFTGTISGAGSTTEWIASFQNNGSQDLSDATTTKINLGTENFDTDNAFSTSNSRWTPLVGKYLIHAEEMGYPNGAGANGFVYYLYKNGSSVFNSNLFLASNTFGNSDNNGKSIVHYLDQTTATDYYEWYIHADTSGVTWKNTRLQINIFKL